MVFYHRFPAALYWSNVPAVMKMKDLLDTTVWSILTPVLMRNRPHEWLSVKYHLNKYSNDTQSTMMEDYSNQTVFHFFPAELSRVEPGSQVCVRGEQLTTAIIDFLDKVPVLKLFVFSPTSHRSAVNHHSLTCHKFNTVILGYGSIP